jgi:excisionase family DNA binding protein
MDELITALRTAVRDEVAAQLAELMLDLKRELAQPEPAAVSPTDDRSADGMLTVQEAAAYAKRHPRTIADACRAGELKGVQRKKGASWRMRREDLDVWMGVRGPERRGPLGAL